MLGLIQGNGFQMGNTAKVVSENDYLTPLLRATEQLI